MVGSVEGVAVYRWGAARVANFEAVALRKLQQLNAATELEFLRV
jgi:hypothetical protein